jgi:hypothetical protein
LTKDYAINEWYAFYEPTPETFQSTKIAPILDCFCKAELKKQKHNLPFTEYVSKDGTKKAYVCSEWI